jgi:clathrin heavy chain
MARKKIKDSKIDTELIYSFANLSTSETNAIADLEEFISGPNIAEIQSVADRCFNEKLYEPARILYASISNYACLASALVKLDKNREAVNAATKANTPKTWKEVMVACVEHKDFKYAQTCALNLVTDSEELDFIMNYYQNKGYFEELIELLEKSLGIERANMPMFTCLGELYAKFKSQKMMDHITRYYRRSNIPKLLMACYNNHLWPEMVFLYKNHDENENAIKIMIDHPVEAFDHTLFTEIIVKLNSSEIFYTSIKFYLDYSPENILDLLSVLTNKLDHERVAKEVRNWGCLFLIKKHLETIQELDLPLVNEALNDLYIEEDDYEQLTNSIMEYKNFDHQFLAKK